MAEAVGSLKHVGNVRSMVVSLVAKVLTALTCGSGPLYMHGRYESKLGVSGPSV